MPAGLPFRRMLLASPLPPNHIPSFLSARPLLRSPSLSQRITDPHLISLSIAARSSRSGFSVLHQGTRTCDSRAGARQERPAISRRLSLLLPLGSLFEVRSIPLSVLSNSGGEAEPDPPGAEMERSQGSKMDELVKRLQQQGVLKSERVARVMRQVDRGCFAPPHLGPYEDYPLPIGFNATISAPHMHAHCLELLERQLQPGAKALDVGSGTGYLTAAFALMVGESGKAVGVEHIPELAELSKRFIKNCSSAKELLEKGVLEIHVADGRRGWPAEAPYDAIHVGAASEDKPQALLDQLKPNGRLVVPVNDPDDYFVSQKLMVYDKDSNGKITEREVAQVRYVPLTSAEQQRRGA